MYSFVINNIQFLVVRVCQEHLLWPGLDLKDWRILGMTNRVLTLLPLWLWHYIDNPPENNGVIHRGGQWPCICPYYRGTEFLESQINPIVIFFFTSLIRLSCARRKWKLACCDQIPDFYLDQVFTRNNKLQQWPPGLAEWRGQSGERGLGTNFSLSCPTINTRGATLEMQHWENLF